MNILSEKERKINEVTNLFKNKKPSIFSSIVSEKVDTEVKQKPAQVDVNATVVADELALIEEMTQNEIELGLEEIDKVIEQKNLALQYYKEKKYIEALRQLENAIRSIPGDLELLFYQALCLFRLNKTERASGLFTKLTDLDKNHALPLLPKMNCYALLQLEKFSEAEIYLEQLISSHRYDLQFHNMYAYALERQNKLDQAEIEYRKVLKSDSENTNALNCLAYICFRKNVNLEEGLSFVKKALKKEPTNAAALDTLAMLLFKKGNIEAAKRALKQAKELAPSNREITSHINLVFSI